MQIRYLSIIGVLLFFLSCKTKDNPTLTSTNKDTVIAEYLNYTSAFRLYDTTNYNYKIVKAYFYNDTIFLRQVLTDIERSKQQKNNSFPDSTKRHPDILKMDVDEVYQFNYSETFCDFTFYFTISKKGDSIKLNSVIYQANREPNFLKLFKESEIALSPNNWNEFKNAMDYGDFWGLTEYKEPSCCDGDFLSVEAIDRSPFDHKILKQRKIARQFVSKTAMYSAYSLLAKFANFKKECYSK